MWIGSSPFYRWCTEAEGGLINSPGTQCEWVSGWGVQGRPDCKALLQDRYCNPYTSEVEITSHCLTGLFCVLSVQVPVKQVINLMACGTLIAGRSQQSVPRTQGALSFHGPVGSALLQCLCRPCSLIGSEGLARKWTLRVQSRWLLS